jgi:excisionase family DNA binding protein
MSNFVELKEAAKMLGVSPDELVEMRSDGKIRGFRDGTSWKFKTDELERAAAELGGGANQVSDADLARGGNELDESVLVSEQELGESGESTSSTVIGQGDAASASDLAVEGGSGIDSDVTLVPGSGGDSDVSLVPDPGSDKELVSPGSDILGSDIELQTASSGGTGDLKISSSSDTGIGSGDLDMGLDSELALSDDDDVVLSGTGSGSDLSLNSADSGINLGSPTDSGLSLEADSGINLQTPTDSGLSLEEDSLDMGGSSISSLELPEDDDVSLDKAASDSGVKQDEQFMLSPSDEMFTDETDSGSQVIALEDSEAFDQEARGGDQLLAESGLDGQLDSLGAGTPMSPAMMRAGYAAELPEAPYSVWNILGLVLIVLFLSVSGIMMTDILRNMWAWEEGRDLSSSIAEGITKAFGL